MTDQTSTTQQLAAINNNLVALFADYCERTASPMLAHMLVAFHEHRLDLVLTAHISATDTYFICCALPVDGDLIRLFEVHEIPVAQSGEVH